MGDNSSEDETFEDFERATIDALNLYDLAICCHSLRQLARGWPIYGKSKNLAVAGAAGVVSGRVVALIGEYKTGKTWLLKMLLQTNLMAHQAIHTPGICLTFAERKDPTPSKKRIPSTLGRGTTRSKKRASSVISKSVPEYDYLFLDSAGTGMATSECRLDDVRATEIFLRKLLVELADKLIFVTSKFNRTSQIAIRAVIDQLNLKPNARVSSVNRLLVVHNLWEVDDQAVLAHRIKEVQEVYEDPEEEEYAAKNKDSKFTYEEEEVDVPAWKEVLEAFDVSGKRHTFVYYNARKTMHVFLVKHGSEDVQDESWRNIHNTCALNVIRTKIRFGLDAKKINVMDEVAEITQREIKNYLKGFDSKKIGLDEFDQVKYLVVKDEKKELERRRKEKERQEKLERLQEKGDEDTEVSNEESEKEESDDEIDLFDLKEMTFTDDGFISDSDKRLNGAVFCSDKEFIISVVMPGVTSKNHVKLKTFSGKQVKIEVNLPSPLTFLPSNWKKKDIKTADNDVIWGKSIYEWTAPKKQKFENLRSAKARDTASSLINGIYFLILRYDTGEDEDDENLQSARRERDESLLAALAASTVEPKKSENGAKPKDKGVKKKKDKPIKQNKEAQMKQRLKLTAKPKPKDGGQKSPTNMDVSS